MNGQVNSAEYDFLWKLLANPADNNHSYIFSLQSLVSDFPQSGALRALLMPNGDKRHVKHAAAYFNPVLLHKLATAPDSFPRVLAEQIVVSDDMVTEPADVHYNIPKAEPFVPPAPTPETEYAQVIDDDVQETPESSPSSRTETEVIVEPSRENIPAYIDDDEPSYSVHEPQHEATIVQPEYVAGVTSAPYHYEEPAVQLPAEQPATEQTSDLAKEYEQYMAKTEITPTEPVSSYVEDEVRYFHQPIEDEVYDEIVSIEDIGLEQLAILNKSAQDSGKGNENYFVFEPEITGDSSAKAQEPSQVYAAPHRTPQYQPQSVPVLAESSTGADYKDDLSKYHDEKMPYTFMWWLDKTRKEHAYIYQPYVSNPSQTTEAPKQTTDERPVLDELQKQYYQSIVSNTSLTDLYNSQSAKMPFNPPIRKEDVIIERFIQEEPHIKHPTDMKLDNENKAKRSSEDQEELVTETLARIYTEQMLYHKAIITYKKLMLKYPEKSLYFAGQIEQLENKIN